MLWISCNFNFNYFYANMSAGLRLSTFDLHLSATKILCIFCQLYGVVHTLFAQKNTDACHLKNGGGGMLPLCTNDAKWKAYPSGAEFHFNAMELIQVVTRCLIICQYINILGHCVLELFQDCISRFFCLFFFLYFVQFFFYFFFL